MNLEIRDVFLVYILYISFMCCQILFASAEHWLPLRQCCWLPTSDPNLIRVSSRYKAYTTVHTLQMLLLKHKPSVGKVQAWFFFIGPLLPSFYKRSFFPPKFIELEQEFSHSPPHHICRILWETRVFVGLNFTQSGVNNKPGPNTNFTFPNRPPWLLSLYMLSMFVDITFTYFA